MRQAVWAVLAAGALAFGGYQVWKFVRPAVPNGHLPSDFPYAFLAPPDDGKRDAVRVWRGRVAPATLDEDGVRRWPVGVCRNPSCPGLANGERFIFARGWQPDAKPAPSAGCPRCAAAGQPSDLVDVWYTPEAEGRLTDVRGDLGLQ